MKKEFKIEIFRINPALTQCRIIQLEEKKQIKNLSQKISNKDNNKSCKIKLERS